MIRKKKKRKILRLIRKKKKKVRDQELTREDQLGTSEKNTTTILMIFSMLQMTLTILLQDQLVGNAFQ